METLQGIIVTKERQSRLLLQGLLAGHCAADIEVGGLFGQVSAALDYLTSNSVGVIFMDAELALDSEWLAHPANDSLRLVLLVGQSPALLESIRCSGLPFLTRPFQAEEVDRLAATLARPAEQGQPWQPTLAQLQAGDLHHNLLQVSFPDSRVGSCEVHALMYLRQEGDALLAYLEGQEPFEVSGTLAQWLTVLDERRFVQVNPQTLVHLPYVTTVDTALPRPHIVVGGQRLPLFRYHLPHFTERHNALAQQAEGIVQA